MNAGTACLPCQGVRGEGGAATRVSCGSVTQQVLHEGGANMSMHGGDGKRGLAPTFARSGLSGASKYAVLLSPEYAMMPAVD
jgi:hypothetical protein